jgi:hypothetical protein
MSDASELINRYIALWNETDGTRRRELIAATFTEGASYVDPLAAVDGHAGIDGMVEAVQARFPGYRFRCCDRVDEHHDRVRFCWELATDGGPAVAGGTDVATLSGQRFAAVTGFIDHAPA